MEDRRIMELENIVAALQGERTSRLEAEKTLSAATVAGIKSAVARDEVANQRAKLEAARREVGYAEARLANAMHYLQEAELEEIKVCEEAVFCKGIAETRQVKAAQWDALRQAIYMGDE